MRKAGVSEYAHLFYRPWDALSVSSPGIPINEVFIEKEQVCGAFTNDILRIREKSDENSGNL